MDFEWRLKVFSSDRDSLVTGRPDHNVLDGEPPLGVPAEHAWVPTTVSIFTYNPAMSEIPNG